MKKHEQYGIYIYLDLCVSQLVKRISRVILSLIICRQQIHHLFYSRELTDLPHTVKIQPSGKNGYLCAIAENQYATVFHFTNPFSPLLSRWLVKEKKGSQPVIICAINGAGYVPVE